VLWKRAEFASSQLKDLNTNEELVFACRSLDWWGGLLVIPEKLRPLVSSDDADSKSLRHERAVLEKAMRPDLTVREMEEDKRLQVYRTAIDSLLSWLVLVRQSLDRHLYETEDAEWIIHWLRLIRHSDFLQPFIHSFGYEKDLERLYKLFQVSAPENVLRMPVMRGRANALDLGSSEEAIAVYDNLLTRFGSATEAPVLEQVARALVNKGIALDALGRSSEAIAVYDDLLVRFGSATEAPILEQVARALVNKGTALDALGRSSEAIAVYDNLLARFATEASILPRALANQSGSAGVTSPREHSHH
jgi:tetratricopeptide (TPR) repeat protein